MKKPAKIKYKNYKGETTDYKIKPLEIYWGKTVYYPDEQWMLKALKVEKNGKEAERHFAMKNILAWWG